MTELIETIIEGLTYTADNPWVIVVAALVALVLTMAYNRIMR